MTKEIIFIVGLPGSGKSTLLEYYKTHPFIDYKIYDEFIHKSEYYLKLNIPDIKITKVYFENNVYKCESNIIYRDKVRGGYWKRNIDDGIDYYYGQLFDDNPLYLKEIDELKQLSKFYIIPKNIKPLSIHVQKD